MKPSTPPPPDPPRDLLPLGSTALGGDQPPTTVRLTPWGTVHSTNGSFVVDEESAELVLAAFAAQGNDLPIDYEHQTLGGPYASPTGQAPAAGWVKALRAEPGVGLLADIEWTEPARSQISQRQYRYLSPVAIVRKGDRKLLAIHSAALTNKPAIAAMEPLVHRAALPPTTPPANPPVEPGPASDEAELLVALREELELPDETAPTTVLLHAHQRLADLQADLQRRHHEHRLEAAAHSGRLTEAQRDWARALLERDEALFDEWLRTAPAVVPCGVTTAPSADGSPPRHHALAARARHEFAAHPLLARLTSESAYVADVLRNASQDEPATP